MEVLLARMEFRRQRTLQRIDRCTVWSKCEVGSGLLCGGADVVADGGFGEGRHDVGNGLKLAVLHDALDAGGVVDVFEGIAGDDDEVGEVAGFDGAEIFGEAVGFCWKDGRGLKGLPWGSSVFDLGAQVQVERVCWEVERGVSSGEDDAVGVEDLCDGGFFVFEVLVSGRLIGCLGGVEGELEACVLPGW